MECGSWGASGAGGCGPVSVLVSAKCGTGRKIHSIGKCTRATDELF